MEREIRLENTQGLTKAQQEIYFRLLYQVTRGAEKFHVSEEDFLNLIDRIMDYFGQPPKNIISVFSETIRGERKIDNPELKLVVTKVDKLSGTGNPHLTQDVLGWVHMALVSNATYQGSIEYFFTRLSSKYIEPRLLSTTSTNKAINLGRLSTEVGLMKREGWGNIPLL